MKCGHCKTTGPAITVAHVRQCSGTPVPASVAVLDRPSNFSDQFSDQHGNWRPRAIQDTNPATRSEDPNQVNPWSVVNELREQVAKHLVREQRGCLVGYYAARVADTDGVTKVKFYRVKKVRNGRVYVDAQASDDYWPVRSPSALTMVLGAIAKSPEQAAMLYASELGRCCRCGRTLTDETSRSVGMGPECRSK